MFTPPPAPRRHEMEEQIQKLKPVGEAFISPAGEKKKAFIPPPVTQPCPLKRRNHSNRHAVNRLNTSVRYMRVSYSTPT